MFNLFRKQMTLKSANDVQYLFHRIVEEANTLNGSSIYDLYQSEAMNSLNAKSQAFQNAEYLAQIEKNAVYLQLCVKEAIAAATSYLTEGGKRPVGEDAKKRAVSELRSRQLGITTLVVNYLHTGAHSNVPGFIISLFVGWRNMRQSEVDQKYIDEMEFSYKWYQTEWFFIQLFLLTLWDNKDLARSARNLTIQEVFQAIQLQVTQVHTNMTWNRPKRNTGQ